MRWLLSGALIGYGLVVMTERDPEQGSQPDHGGPFWRAWPRKALFAGRVTQECPRCRSRDLRFANDLSFWCAHCDRSFSPPMSYEEAMVYFTEAA